MAKDIILALVVVGFLLAMLGLWFHALQVFCAGVLIGGLLPSIVGICITK